MKSHGSVAQLGERVVRNDEVRSSILLGSTKSDKTVAMRPSKIVLLCLLPFTATHPAMAQQPAGPAEQPPASASLSRFFFKVGAHKGTVLVVYVTADFLDLYIWEKEALMEPLFKAEHAKSATLTTIALRDAKSGKTVGTYAPKAGVSML